MLRLGLCCLFRKVDIRFQTATVTYVSKFKEPLPYLSQRALSNAVSLEKALHYCVEHGIGDFRIGSTLLPIADHPKLGYEVEELPDGEEILARFAK